MRSKNENIVEPFKITSVKEIHIDDTSNNIKDHSPEKSSVHNTEENFDNDEVSEIKTSQKRNQAEINVNLESDLKQDPLPYKNSERTMENLWQGSEKTIENPYMKSQRTIENPWQDSERTIENLRKSSEMIIEDPQIDLHKTIENLDKDSEKTIENLCKDSKRTMENISQGSAKTIENPVKTSHRTIENHQQDSEKTIENHQQDSEKTIENPCRDSERTLENPQQDSERTLENPQQDSERTIENPQQDLEKSIENPCRDSQRTIENPQQDSEQTIENPCISSEKVLENPQQHSEKRPENPSKVYETTPDNDSEASLELREIRERIVEPEEDISHNLNSKSSRDILNLLVVAEDVRKPKFNPRRDLMINIEKSDFIQKTEESSKKETKVSILETSEFEKYPEDTSKKEIMTSVEQSEFDKNRFTKNTEDIDYISEKKPKRNVKHKKSGSDQIKKNFAKTTSKLGDLLYISSPNKMPKTAKTKKEDDNLPIYLRKAIEKKSKFTAAISPTRNLNKSTDRGQVVSLKKKLAKNFHGDARHLNSASQERKNEMLKSSHDIFKKTKFQNASTTNLIKVSETNLNKGKKNKTKSQMNSLFGTYNQNKTLKTNSSRQNTRVPFYNNMDPKPKQKISTRLTIDDAYKSKNILNVSSSYKYLKPATSKAKLQVQPITVNENPVITPNTKTSEALKRDFNRIINQKYENYVRQVKSASREYEKKMISDMHYVSKNLKSGQGVSSKSKDKSYSKGRFSKRCESKEKQHKDLNSPIKEAQKSTGLNLVKKLRNFNANYEGFRMKKY